MGGCCCSSRKHPLHGTTLYYYCPPIMQEHESLTSHNSATTVLTRRFLVDLNLDTSTPDTYQSPPAPVSYDMILGCLQSSNAESLREIISPGGFKNLSGVNLKESDCRTYTCPASPKELEVEILKSSELIVSAVEEDGCPTCLEDFDAENPKIITKCNHHFHLSCILEWMERSDTCPICDQEMIFEAI